MDYISAFANLKTNNKYIRKSPHKAVLLLTVIEMFEKGLISKNEIRYDDILITTFQHVWNRILPTETTFYTNVYFPFWYLHSEIFWHIVPFRNREDSFKSIWNNKVKPTESKVKEIVQYAELDEDLYFLMTMPSGRSSLKRILLETYSSLPEKDIELFSVSEDSAIDNSISAINQFQKSLMNVDFVDTSSNQNMSNDMVVHAFAELSEDMQIALYFEYYKFLKTQPLERELFKKLFPSTAELYYHIKCQPYKGSQIDISLQSVLTNFLYDLRIALMSEDEAMSFIDSINEAIHILQDGTRVEVDISTFHDESFDNQSQEADVTAELNKGKFRQESKLAYHYSVDEETESSVEERIAKLRKELEGSDNVEAKSNYRLHKDESNLDANRFKQLQELFSVGESRRGISWSQDEEEYVTLCFKRGYTPTIIADKIGRTENAVLSRLVMLRLIDDDIFGDNSASLQTPIKTTLNLPSDSIPAGYTIDNMGGHCFILNEKKERVFTDSGYLTIVRGKIYRFKIQNVCFTMKAIIVQNGQWRKSGKMLVAYSTSALYKILSQSTFVNDIEDIVEGDNIYHNKIKVRGHWFDYNGNLI